MVKKIACIGAGSMAEAIIAGLVNKNFIKNEHIFVTNNGNEQRLLELQNKYNITGLLNKERVLEGADVILLATKPHDIKSVIIDIKENVSVKQLIISVAAGVPSSLIESTLEQRVPVVRSMPNTSAMIGQSATAISKGSFATDEHIQIAQKIFEAIGSVSVVNEEDMHIVTAISGSGPAYIYYLVEAMEKVAQEEGLDEETAKTLITHTIIGAGNMLKHATESASTLRENVTSPNGTTEAGLNILAHYKFQEAVSECIKRAKERSIELGKDM